MSITSFQVPHVPEVPVPDNAEQVCLPASRDLRDFKDFAEKPSLLWAFLLFKIRMRWKPSKERLEKIAEFLGYGPFNTGY